MIKNEKIFVCFTLFTIGVECLRNFRTYKQPSYNPQIGYPYGFDQAQGEVQLQSMNGFSTIPRIQQMQPRMQQIQPRMQQMQPQIQQMQDRPQNSWTYQRGTPQQPQTATTTTYGSDMWGYPNPEQPTEETTPQTTTQRFLPRSPVRLRSRTTTSESTEPSTSTHRPFRKFGHGPVDTTPEIDNTVISSGKDKALAHIASNLQQFFLRAILQDFIVRLSASVHASNVLLSHNELAALGNQCSSCTMPEMQGLLTVLLTIMEKYPPLIGDTILSEHVATEYERAKEYLNRKLDLLRKETSTIQVDNDFRDVKKRYTRRERHGGIMSLLLEWFEDYARSGRVDEENLQMKLLKYLTTQKRYWLISIRGVLS